MQPRARIPLIGIFSALLLTFGSLTSAAPVVPDDEATQQVIVRAAYENLRQFATFSAPDLHFSLSDFRTLLPHELNQARWLDIVTMPGGLSLEMTPHARQNGNTGETRVSFDARWKAVDRTWLKTAEGPRLRTLRVAEVLSEVAQRQPEYARVLAVTTFRVRVQAGGQERSYRAAFLWVPPAEGDEAAFIVMDHVTQGVEEAARESRPAVKDLLFLDTPENPSVQDKATCSAWSSPTSNTYTATGNDGHVSGNHQRTVKFQIVCSCSSTCVSKCVATIPSASCSDSGLTDMCHKMASALQGSTTQQDNGKVTAAGCAAGFGCVERPCLFCACGLSVGVSINGVSVNFSSSEATWSANRDYSRTCAKCT